jgi:hypothetical protein
LVESLVVKMVGLKAGSLADWMVAWKGFLLVGCSAASRVVL